MDLRIFGYLDAKTCEPGLVVRRAAFRLLTMRPSRRLRWSEDLMV